jgi:hypothetical protein
MQTTMIAPHGRSVRARLCMKAATKPLEFSTGKCPAGRANTPLPRIQILLALREHALSHASAIAHLILEAQAHLAVGDDAGFCDCAVRAAHEEQGLHRRVLEIDAVTGGARAQGGAR